MKHLVLAILFLAAIVCRIDAQPPAKTHQVKLNGHTFTLPAGFEIELVAGPPLVDRPITADFDEQGRLYVSDSSGSNEKLTIQLEKKPHRIVRLESSKGDGKFDRRTIFADKMMFPEGTMWHAGSLYVSAPPSIWKLTDTDGDGVADIRTEWFKGKTLTGCGNDLHGPYLGPDGWIYWCKGAFANQSYERPGKKPFLTRAAHIFRARPDGSGVEHVMTGGMDNPVDVVFTPGGERIFTTTFLQFPGGGKRDGLIHAVYGGVYGKDWDVNYNHPWTGPSLMPPLTHLGAAAPSGLHRYESRAFGPEYQDNLFAVCFNMQKVTRHVLVPDGSTFKTKDEDFLLSDNKDFHPTDVLEDADGSLLVIDTGGWYKLCCPTSQLVKPDVLGAIYRVKRAEAPKIDDPRGLKLNWSKLSAAGLTKLLGDDRPAVRRRAMEMLATTVVPGGTILVFEIDRKGQEYSLKQLTESLRQRIDPNDTMNVIIRPAGDGRIEIILPAGAPRPKGKQDLTPDDVQRIKELVSMAGHLEFVVLANSADDKRAIEDVTKQLESEDFKTELEDRQKEGLPPPGPRQPNKVPDIYTIKLAKSSKSLVSYRWIELGQQERKQLNLDNAAELDAERNATWNAAKLKRGRASTLPDLSPAKRPLMQGALFYSRECRDRNLPEEVRRAKKVEYFVLVRNPEMDLTDPTRQKQTPPINGSLLKDARANAPGERPSVNFSFNNLGSKLFGDLTGKNAPTGDGETQVRRHLGIVLDGMLMAAPHLMAQIKTGGQLSGTFTQKEVDAMVKILRSGALPATLKPQPVSESVMFSQPQVLEDLYRAPGTPPSVRRNVVWTATRIDGPYFRGLVRRALSDADETVRHAALHSVSVWRDRDALPQLLKILKSGTSPNRRAAAEAIGRIGDRAAVPSLLEAAGTPMDRFLEHSVTYALIEIGDHDATAIGLKSDNAAVRRAALIALDQMEGSRLEPTAVADALTSTDAKLQEASWWIAGRHPEWGQTLGKFFHARMAAKDLNPTARKDLVSQLAKLARSPHIQSMLGERLAASKDVNERRLVLQAMAQARLKDTPASWLSGIEHVLTADDAELVRSGLATIRAWPQVKKLPAGLTASLVKLGEDDKQPVEVRLQALSIVPGKLTSAQFAMIRAEVKADRPVITRALAADILSRVPLARDELLALVQILPEVGPMELHRILEAFAQSRDDAVGRGLLAGLHKLPSLSAVRSDRLKLSLAKYSPAVHKEADKIFAALNADAGKQKARLEKLIVDLEKGEKGDIRRGQLVFNSAKTACASCHAIGYLGGNIGPDLTRIGQIRTERDLLEAIVFPSASFVRSYEPVQVSTKAGKVYNGIVRRDNAEEILLVMAANQEVVIQRTDIEDMQPSRVSIMPSGLDQQLTPRDLADLVAFLRACK